MRKEDRQQLADELGDATGEWLRATYAHRAVGSDETRAAMVEADRRLAAIEERVRQMRTAEVTESSS